MGRNWARIVFQDDSKLRLGCITSWRYFRNVPEGLNLLSCFCYVSCLSLWIYCLLTSSDLFLIPRIDIAAMAKHSLPGRAQLCRILPTC